MSTMNAEETKRWKAKNLRYKKPMVKELNLDTIREKLFDIQGECEEVRWYTDSEDGEDSLLNALDGDEDEVYEFKVALFPLHSIAAGDQFGGLLGYDSYEGDYFGINCMDAWAEDEAKKKLKQLTKDELIAAIRQSFKVYQSYIGLSVSYDSLKAAIDILRDKNTGILQVVKEIERLYEAASSEQGIYAEYSKAWKEFDQYTESLPPEAWVS